MYLIYSTKFMSVHALHTFSEEANTRRLFIPHQATNHFELLHSILGPVLLQQWKNVCLSSHILQKARFRFYNSLLALVFIG